MASAIAQDTSLYSTARQSFRPIHAVRTTAITMTRAFDALCALSVMLITFVTLNVRRMPGGLQEFLTLRLTVKNFMVALLLLVIWHTSFAAFGLYQATRVRYCWADGPVCTLFDGANLPAGPFEIALPTASTDDHAR